MKSRDRANESRLSGLPADLLARECPNSRRLEWEISKINPLEIEEKSKDEVVTNFFNEQERPSYLDTYANRWDPQGPIVPVERLHSSRIQVLEATMQTGAENSPFRPFGASARPSRKSCLQTDPLDRTGEVSGAGRRHFDLAESSLPGCAQGLLSYPEVGKLGIQMSGLSKLHEENLESLEKSKSLLRDVNKMKRTCVKLKTAKYFDPDKTALETTLARTGCVNINQSASHLGLSSIHHFDLEKSKTANRIENTEYCLMKAIDMAGESPEKSNYKTSNFNERVVFEFDENHNPNVELLPNLKPQTLKIEDSRKGQAAQPYKEPLGDATNLLQAIRPFNPQGRHEPESAIGARREAFQQKGVDSKFFSFRGNYILQEENRTSGLSRYELGRNPRAFNPQEKVDMARQPAPAHPTADRPNRGPEKRQQVAPDEFDMTLKYQNNVEVEKPASNKAIRFD